MFSLLFRFGLYEQAQIAGVFRFGILVIAATFAWMAFAKSGPRSVPMSTIGAVIVVPFTLAILLFEGIAQYNLAYAVDRFVELDVLNAEFYFDSLEAFSNDSLGYLFSLGFVIAAAFLREICLRGFVIGGMLKNGAGLISVSFMSAMLDALIVIVTVLISVIIELTRMLEYGLDNDFFGFTLMRQGGPILVAAMSGFALGMLRALSGRVWPGLLLSLMAGMASMLILLQL